MTKRNRKNYVPEKQRSVLTTGRVIAILRELKEWTQEDLAKKSGLSATNISKLENNRIEIGKKRALSIAKAFGVHPATIMFPEYVPAKDLENVA